MAKIRTELPKIMSISVSMAMVGLLTAGTFMSKISVLKNETDSTYLATPERNDDLKKIKEQVVLIDTYRQETIELKNLLEGLKNSSTMTSETIRIESLEAKVNTLQKRFESISEILGNSPEKAMSLPLMRKDIDSIDKSIKVVSENTDRQLERFINLFYWICGTLAFGIVGLCVGLYSATRKST